ncbi:unnamed protein product [Spirodela intermedia]|uniref:3-isopropylmalate dehydratase n=1 Tax=Spirodela intermedia TaxID=51605 RepID=A0A7I8JHS9_SPIIN|nr:unnamed protein product [Spirodela intermedia]CAA6668992.1 unnamed protein product [Spirodela intermedia]
MSFSQGGPEAIGGPDSLIFLQPVNGLGCVVDELAHFQEFETKFIKRGKYSRYTILPWHSGDDDDDDDGRGGGGDGDGERRCSPLFPSLSSPPAEKVFFCWLPLRRHRQAATAPPIGLHQPPNPSPRFSPVVAAAATPARSSTSTFHGPCYVVGDNIDTDQIIPAQYLTLVPSKPDEYRKLGSFALIGLPHDAYQIPFVEPGHETTRFPIIIGGSNFGCGSSREHAPVALGAAGVRAVVAESYARIFFRNSVSTGEVYPVESEAVGMWKECSTGDIVTVDLAENALINHSTGKQYTLKPIGDAGPVVEAGGIFAYARQTGMISSARSD